MKALDTNILVRFLTSDDPAAYKRVAQLLESAEQRNESFRLTTLVLLELMWVLKARYRLTRDEILEAIEKLLRMPVVTFESPECTSALILRGRSTSLDLADILIGLNARQQGCETIHTLDKKAAQSELFEEIP